ncbi:MAG TPA: VTT domain-containing protein [Woeseiaceae bacterium]|nr:VTT domain-containing protein [Woeseiaceae bacterium]
MAETLRRDVLEEGRTVWKLTHADRAAVLVDAADYFGALRAAMGAATRSITVVGWDIDSRTPLVGRSGEAPDGAPATLLAFIEALVEKRPLLDVRLLLWDYTILYALDREPLPSLNLKWRTPPQVKVELDSCLPLGACHHQKLVIVDGNLAFCGGLDLTTRRWDTPEHRPRHPFRRDADDKPYPPFHDIQMLVDGEAAKHLAGIASRRWREAAGEKISVVETEVRWPENVAPDCQDVEVGIAQTLPATDEREAVKQVYELYLATIRTARRYIYIENQYLTSDEIAEALAARVREIPELEVLVITPWAPEGWLEKRTMGAGQQRVMQKLSQEGLGARVKFLYPWVGSAREQTPVMVHAKLMIVDDLFLRVGSSNLNNRSMGVDTECDLLLRASTDGHRAGIRSVLHRLLAEHLGLDVSEVADKWQESGSLLKLAQGKWCDERGLKPLRQHAKYQALSETLNLVADPEVPLEPSEFVGDMFGAAGGNRYATRRVLKLAAIAAMLLLLLLAWSYTPLKDFADPEAVADALYRVRSEWWIYPAVLAAFVFGGILLFPVTVMIAVSGMLLGPWTGWFYAMLGSMLSAWVGHATGRWLGGSPLRNISGRAFRAVSQALKNQGVIAVAALRMVPIAPYTVVNMAMGAAGVSARVFLAGSFLGMLPGTFVLTMLGDRLREAWQEPAPANLVLFALVVVLWLGLAFVLQQVVSRLKKRER